MGEEPVACNFFLLNDSYHSERTEKAVTITFYKLLFSVILTVNAVNIT